MSIIICLYLTFMLIQTLVDILLALGSLGMAFIFYASTQPVFWPALITLFVTVGLTLALPVNSREILRSLIVRKLKRV